jgi:uncharacterized protein (DUF2141 family)
MKKRILSMFIAAAIIISMTTIPTVSANIADRAEMTLELHETHRGLRIEGNSESIYRINVPATGTLNFVITIPSGGGSWHNTNPSLRFHNASGEIIYEHRQAARSHTIENLQAGTYFIEIINRNTGNRTFDICLRFNPPDMSKISGLATPLALHETHRGLRVEDNSSAFFKIETNNHGELNLVVTIPSRGGSWHNTNPSMSIYNMNGETVYEHRQAQRNHTIGNLPADTYIIEIINRNTGNRTFDVNVRFTADTTAPPPPPTPPTPPPTPTLTPPPPADIVSADPIISNSAVTGIVLVFSGQHGDLNTADIVFSMLRNNVVVISSLADFRNEIERTFASNRTTYTFNLRETIPVTATDNLSFGATYRNIDLVQALATPNLTTADALTVLRAAVGLTALTSAQRTRFSITGTPATSDALRILRTAVGL